VPAAKHQQCVDWYLAALKPLGYAKLMEFGEKGEVVGIGANNVPDWWIVGSEKGSTVGCHIAFTAESK
jgi:hypothetical protein